MGEQVRKHKSALVFTVEQGAHGAGAEGGVVGTGDLDSGSGLGFQRSMGKVQQLQFSLSKCENWEESNIQVKGGEGGWCQGRRR
jgi:hypothetical protein